MTAFSYRLSSRAGPINVEDYRRLARRKLPDMVWAYVDHGAEDLHTMCDNRTAFDRYRLRTRVLTGHASTGIATTVAGQPLSLPVVLAPTGLVGLSHWTGERGAAQAAEAAGTLSIAGSGASYTVEEIAEGVSRGHFFQLYPWAEIGGGRHDLIGSLLGRAERAGYSAVFVTVDVPVPGNKEVERRRGMGNPPVLTPRRILNASRKPRWCAGLLRHQRISIRNLENTGGARSAVRSLTAQFRLMRPELTWDDFAWMRDHWEGPLFVKGILDPDDADRAVSLGADGIVVSNHGGRQLDGAIAALDALPGIVDRVGSRAEILLDGGIRRGIDVVKALCLGARAVAIGRPYLYGIAAAGPSGVEHILEIFREEITRCLMLMGVADIADLDRSWLLPADPAYVDGRDARTWPNIH